MQGFGGRPEKLMFPEHYWMVARIEDGEVPSTTAHLFPAFAYTALCGYNAEAESRGFAFSRVGKGLDDDLCAACVLATGGHD